MSIQLSAIVQAPHGFEAVRTTLRHLAAQSIARKMEIVLVAPSRVGLGADGDLLAAFGSWKVVEASGAPSGAAGYAAGVREAGAPIVVFTEDHCFPGPGWAEALLGAYANGCVAVGPVVANASHRESAVAWADFMLGYGPWLDPSPGGEVDYLPGHNSSYRRDVLLEYEPELEAWLEAESLLHWDLRKKGRRLWLEPAARTHHFNFSLVRPWLAATFFQSRTFAGRRMRDVGKPRRLAWAAASPLIPAIRLHRCVRDLGRCPERPGLARLAPALTVALVTSAIGEAAGYLFGPGEAPARVSPYEFRRDRHVTSRDRAAMAEARFWE
ncbi:MAG: glycosyltransferase family 2 protein [Gemmatimonadota bacterium]